MVDALRRAHEVVTQSGIIVDVHPTAELSLVQVGSETTGQVVVDDGPLRHAAADAAVRAVIDEGLFTIDGAVEFDFYTYGDTVDELREYIVDNWRNAEIDEGTMARTRQALARSGKGMKPRARERVRLTIMRPIGRWSQISIFSGVST